MTMAELQQYVDLKTEIKELQEELDNLNRKGLVVDKVQASNREYPYQPISTTITGIAEDKRTGKRKLQIRMLLDDRIQQSYDLMVKIMQYINDTPDAQLRRIMRLRYIEGLTWEKTAQLVGCERTTAQKKVKRYVSRK